MRDKTHSGAQCIPCKLRAFQGYIVHVAVELHYMGQTLFLATSTQGGVSLLHANFVFSLLFIRFDNSSGTPSSSELIDTTFKFSSQASLSATYSNTAGSDSAQ